MPKQKTAKSLKEKLNAKFIFVVGGVMSGVGKGVAAASIGRILIGKGFNVSAIKIDPYINVDAGTMNPVEHGEVFVTDDGDETDQDCGNYERFLGRDIHKENYLTTGRVYLNVITRERNLEFGGKCVEVVPHIPLEVIKRIKEAAKKDQADIMIIEIGGTVGEYQNLLFLEAARMMHLDNPNNVLFVMVSYLPIPSKIGEMKTKPTQYAVHSLQAAGIQPDFILARSERPIDGPRSVKLATFCNVREGDIISAPDVDSIYEIPINFEKNNLGDKILAKFGLKTKKKDLVDWRAMADRIKNAKQEVKIGIVGKYFGTGDFTLSDSYISVIEAIKHAGGAVGAKPILSWINAEEVEKEGTKILEELDGIIVPQGWGSRGAEGKIATIKYCRETKLPYFGLCYGMQMAVIEFARNVLDFKDANSEEVDPKTAYPVIHIMPNQKEYLVKKQYGGTIRLGAWPCKLVAGTHIAKAYGSKLDISERHRHRYEFNNKYREQFEAAGMAIGGASPDGQLVEAIEITGHPFFIGTQFHPEYKSRPLEPHPLFAEFIKVCAKKK
ncbi:CTP synthase [Candidatus Falkowbacteria bacterium CG10_big_fil_rev_8_21_14_0_10_43_11]|uniref:CTP synthase n=1 Tax=Candidatus Falkowbacteria bacterium CG10_big_fil_rev_8_21_14_0_10_43_11 TaxID=1974568 RepID=A0A2M6WL46_9BACT|nr:MAG: CTP synthase [Candidatus Falkowbacteria bacterium CG10_big_fil_rev_8_21_14_0_10_43_11]